MPTTLSHHKHPAAKIGLKKHARGTIVRVQNQTGYFTVSSPSGWSGPGYAFPISYNLFDHERRKVVNHPAGLVVALKEEELAEASRVIETFQEKPKKVQQAQSRITPSERMLEVQDLTRRMGRFYLGEQAHSMELDTLIRALLPKYRNTHCWKCSKTDLNNLDFGLCPACRGIICTCGACLCGRPW
jgi:hypothetical protein